MQQTAKLVVQKLCPAAAGAIFVSGTLDSDDSDVTDSDDSDDSDGLLILFSCPARMHGKQALCQKGLT